MSVPASMRVNTCVRRAKSSVESSVHWCSGLLGPKGLYGEKFRAEEDHELTPGDFGSLGGSSRYPSDDLSYHRRGWRNPKSTCRICLP
jgi:hypothetical protein